MLWAITAYFNPCGYRARLANYRLFRARLNVPLVAVEASFDGRFDLGPDDAEILVRRRARDVMWQKERLLNIALEVLPDECTDVAWLDCDVIFLSDDWAARASAALETNGLVHLCSERYNLPRWAIGDPAETAGLPVLRSGLSLAAGELAPEDLFDADAPLTRGTTVGLAWAIRRAALPPQGLYDACILGSADRVILCAAVGEIALGARAACMTPRQIEHYRPWAETFHEAIGGRVGHIEGRICHLWHGDLGDRRYVERFQILRHHRFDPFTDIALDDGGCWRWSTAKPLLHEQVRSYFAARREDGAEPEPEARDYSGWARARSIQ